MTILEAVEAGAPASTASAASTAVRTVALHMALLTTAVAAASSTASTTASTTLRTVALHVTRTTAAVAGACAATDIANAIAIAIAIVDRKAVVAAPASRGANVGRGFEAVAAAPRIILSAAGGVAPGRLGGAEDEISIGIARGGSLVLLGLSLLVLDLAVGLGVLVSGPVLGHNGALADPTFGVCRLDVARLAIRVGDHVRSHDGTVTASHCCDRRSRWKVRSGKCQKVHP